MRLPQLTLIPMKINSLILIAIYQPWKGVFEPLQEALRLKLQNKAFLEELDQGASRLDFMTFYDIHTTGASILLRVFLDVLYSLQQLICHWILLIMKITTPKPRPQLDQLMNPD